MIGGSNPVLNDRTFADSRWGGIQADLERSSGSGAVASASRTMTLRGTALKLLALLTLTVGTGAGAAWWITSSGNTQLMRPMMFGGMIGALVLSLVISFVPKTAPIVAPIYALAKGVFLGLVTLMYAQAFNGLVVPAVVITLTIAIGLGILYATGLIRIGAGLGKFIMVGVLGVALLYVVQLVGGLLGFPILGVIHQAGPIGIGFSIFVIILASLSLVWAYQHVEEGVQAGAPKFMEWYCAFGILVQVVWLYLEILNLLRKLQQR